MSELQDILKKIFGLDKTDTVGAVLERAKKVHRKILQRWLLILLALVVFGICCNVSQKWQVVNIVIYVFLVLLVLITSTNPKILLSILSFGFISGAVKTPETVAEEIKAYFKDYFGAIGEILLWVSIVYMYLVFFPLYLNPKAIMPGLISLATLGLISWKWIRGVTLYKRIIYFNSIAFFVFSLISFVPNYTWIKYTGVDVPSYFGINESTKALAAFEKARSEFEDEENSKRIKRITAEMEKGIYPSTSKKPGENESDAEFMERMRKENTLPGKISSLLKTSAQSHPNNSSRWINIGSYSTAYAGAAYHSYFLPGKYKVFPPAYISRKDIWTKDKVSEFRSEGEWISVDPNQKTTLSFSRWED